MKTTDIMKIGYVKTVAGLFGLLALVLSCEKEVGKYEEIALEPITVGHDMSSAIMEIEVPMSTVSNEWYVNSPTDDAWLTHEIIPGTKSLWVMMDGNVTGKVRSSYIQIRSKGQMQKIVVNQDCEPVMVLSRSTANFRYQGGSQSVKVVNFKDLKNVVPQVADTWVKAHLQEDGIVLEAEENTADQRRETVLTVTAQRAITGEQVSMTVTLSQDKYGQKPSYEYSVDGGQTWLEDIPLEFDVLAVRTNNGVKLSQAELVAYKAAVDGQSAPAGLDLSEAEYESVTFPADLFAGSAIQPNKTLKFIKFPKNVTTIPDKAFYYCTVLETVDLTGIVTLGKEVFRFSALKELNVPNTVKEYGTHVFADIPTLTSVYYNSPYDSGTSKEGNIYTFYLDKTDISAPGLVITVGPDVTYIPRCAFRHNNTLVKIILEGSSYFRQYSIAYCENLATIEFLSTENINKIGFASMWDNEGMYAGQNVTEDNRRIVVPKGFLEEYEAITSFSRFDGTGYEIVEKQ